MKLFNTILTALLITLLSSPSWSVPLEQLVKRDGLYYPKFRDVPFTGEVTGQYQGTIKNGKKHGGWLSYYDTGQLSSKGNYKNGQKEGTWVIYRTGGNIWEKGNYKNDERTGDWVGFWSNGQLMSKGNYENGDKEGTWVEFSADGTPWESLTGTYNDGVKISD